MWGCLFGSPSGSPGRIWTEQDLPQTGSARQNTVSCLIGCSQPEGTPMLKSVSTGGEKVQNSMSE